MTIASDKQCEMRVQHSLLDVPRFEIHKATETEFSTTAEYYSASSVALTHNPGNVDGKRSIQSV